ncbi:MAG: 30S ribosomal protein S16 [Candidatus Omnitrophica bacterium]|nr:30S ribosomal protein S16 [Candidatus Omnitrophota bacterium]
MAVHIRLRRTGTTKKPHWRIVVADSRMPRDGRVVETLGYYDATRSPSVVEVDGGKLKDWIRKGAKLSIPVTKLLREKKVI